MAGLRRPQPGCYCRTAAAVNLLLGVFQVLLPCCRPGGAQGQAIEPLPNVVELWQAEEGELLLPTQGDSEENMEEHSQEQRYMETLNGTWTDETFRESAFRSRHPDSLLKLS
ncbi:transmembrane protein 131-like [Lycaon pictus]